MLRLCATGNLRAVQILLGHGKIENTIRYRGVDIDDALVLSERRRPENIRAPAQRISDSGPSYIAGALAEYIEARKMSDVRGAPMHPQTQGKIERWHQTRTAELRSASNQ